MLEVTLEEVRILDAERKVRRNLTPFEPIEIEISYRCHRQVPVIDCSVTLDFEDGTSVAFWRAKDRNAMQTPNGDRGTFRLSLPHPPLLPGGYTLTVALSPPDGVEAWNHYDIHFRLHHFAVLSTGKQFTVAPVGLNPTAAWADSEE